MNSTERLTLTLTALARDCERASRDGRMTLAQSQALKRFYERELDGYAYLEPAGA